MASISQQMNMSTALQMLEDHNQASPVLIQLAHKAANSHHSKHHRSFLKKLGQGPQGYGGFQPALVGVCRFMCKL